MANPNNELGLPPLNEYYMMMAFVAASRANCLNRAVGSVLVTPDGGSVAATGYNGVPRGLPHCVTCRRREEGYGSGEGLHRSRAEHAERSVIEQAAKYGRKTEGCIMYVTDMPCSECSKAIINAGIKKLYYCSEYPGTEARIMLGSVGIEIVQLDKPKILNHLQAFIKAIGN
ncbi:tRNA-specific adenosine deaminase [compost metagenome]